MAYEGAINVLNSLNLYAWIIAAVCSYLVQKYIKSRGWTLIMVGSCFTAFRQFWEVYAPGYSAAEASSVMFNAFMMRYLFGVIGAILIIAGLSMLIKHYFVVRTILEESK